MAQAILEEKARIAKSISGPPVSLAPTSVETKLAPRVNGAAGSQMNGVQISPVALKKAVVLDLVDELAAKQGVGMERAEQGVTLGQKDFVRALSEMLQVRRADRSSSTTELLLTSLARCWNERRSLLSLQLCMLDILRGVRKIEMELRNEKGGVPSLIAEV